MKVVVSIRNYCDVSPELRDTKFGRHNQDQRRVRTHQTRQEHPEGGPYFPLPPNKDWVGIALDIAPSVHTEVPDRTDHILPSHEQGPPDNGEEHGTEEGADETFNGLFG